MKPVAFKVVSVARLEQWRSQEELICFIATHGSNPKAAGIVFLFVMIMKMTRKQCLQATERKKLGVFPFFVLI